MVDGKQHKPGMPGKARPQQPQRTASGLTRPGDLYLPGDALPVPEVVEKNTDSVWALWSDMVDAENKAPAAAEPDFKETVPMDFDAQEPTRPMDLPDPGDDPKRGAR